MVGGGGDGRDMGRGTGRVIVGGAREGHSGRGMGRVIVGGGMGRGVGGCCTFDGMVLPIDEVVGLRMLSDSASVRSFTPPSSLSALM